MALEYTPKFHGVCIYDSTRGDFIFALPLIYDHNAGEWKHVDIKIWNGSSWGMVGGACTKIIPFNASAQPFVTQATQDFLVPEYLGNARLKDSAGNGLNDSAGNKLYGEYRGT